MSLSYIQLNHSQNICNSFNIIIFGQETVGHKKHQNLWHNMNQNPELSGLINQVHKAGKMQNKHVSALCHNKLIVLRVKYVLLPQYMVIVKRVYEVVGQALN